MKTHILHYTTVNNASLTLLHRTLAQPANLDIHVELSIKALSGSCQKL